MSAVARPTAPHTEAEKRNCSFCGEFADDDLSITHRQCGARTHADCLPTGKPVNYKLCSICTGEAITLGDVASMDVTPVSATNGREPFPPDGVDYVLQPGQKQKQSAGGSGAWKMVAGLFSRVGGTKTAPVPAAAEDVKTSQDPEFLIKNRVPVRDMLRFNKLGLQHLLKQGVDMTDFLSNGYTWNDLLLYEDVGRKGATRAKQALMALRCNANHFRDYPDALPYKKVAEHAQLQPYDLGTCFGLGFPTDPPGSLQCMGDENWTARDCVRLGLNMDDLRDFGLVGLQQYEDLMVGLSKPDAIAAERDLKVTPEHIGSLVDLMMAPPPRQPEPSAAPIVKKPVVVPQSAPIAIPVAVEQEEQEEFFSAPPAVVRQRPVVVAVPMAVRAPPPPQRVIVQAQPTPIGTKNKFDRHGALVRHVIIK